MENLFKFGLFHLLYTQNGQNLFVYAGYMTDREKLKVFFEKKNRCLTKIKIIILLSLHENYPPRRRGVIDFERFAG